MSTPKVIDKDHGYKRLIRDMVKHTGHEALCSVGVMGEAAAAVHDSESRATVAEIASFNEFGLGVPERSFLRAWFDEAAEKNKALARKLGVLRAEGKIDEKRSLAIMGAHAVGEIQARISRGIQPPNAESTIERKGSSTPLIDHGILRSSISYKVG